MYFKFLCNYIVFGIVFNNSLIESKQKYIGRPNYNISNIDKLVELKEYKNLTSLLKSLNIKDDNIDFLSLVSRLNQQNKMDSSNYRCEQCKLSFYFSSLYAKNGGPKGKFVELLQLLCKDEVKQSKVVCQGFLKSLGPVLFDILKVLDLKDPNSLQALCCVYNKSCKMPKIKRIKLKLPFKRKPDVGLEPSGKYKYMLHVTDIHYDPGYKEGSEADCDKPICCQSNSKNLLKNTDSSKSISRSASRWGDYSCDTPKLLLESMFKSLKAADELYNFDIILFTGDVVAHDAWKESVNKTKTSLEYVYNLFNKHFNFNRTKIYSSIGNHESIPANQFPLQNQINHQKFFLYEFLKQQWGNWLPTQALNEFEMDGYYAINHTDKLKVIVINTNLCYKPNLYLLLTLNQTDPGHMLQWLINQLQSAEDSGVKVYITSHTSPNSKDCYKHWAKQFYRIVQRYKNTIVAQFFGHIHRNQFEVFYDTKGRPINTAYLTSSLAPMYTINPGYKVFKVDSQSYNVVDYYQYYFDLNRKEEWKLEAQQQLLYEARKRYKVNQKYLSPKVWDEVVNSMERNVTMFREFFGNRKNNANLDEECDIRCREKIFKELRPEF